MKKSMTFTREIQPLFRTTFVLFLVFVCYQVGNSQMQVNLSGGVAVGYSPNLVYEESNGQTHEGKGNTFSIFGEMLVNQRFMGRLQTVSLLVGTYSGDFKEKIKSGRSFTGSLGFVLGNPDSKLTIPIMGSAGAGIISYDNFTDSSLQLGITSGPHLKLTEHLSVLAELRYLKGYATGDESRPVSQTDFLLGLKFTL